MQSHSFGTMILLGNQSWISVFKQYLHCCGSTITNPTHNRLDMTIYQTGGIDYIFPKVNLNDIDDVSRAASKIKDFIKHKFYLEEHMIFFLNYMSPKFHQVLAFLSTSEIDTCIVSLKPCAATESLYFQVCRELSLRIHIVRKQELDDEIKTIIRGAFDNFGTLAELIENDL